MIKKIDEKLVKTLLPKRPIDANKGTFGKVLIIGGSDSYPGAPHLSALAAGRVGAGLISIASIPSVRLFTAKKNLEFTYLILKNEKGFIAKESAEIIKEKLSEYDVLLIGPGLGKSNGTKQFLKKLLGYFSKENILPKIILDADALNILSEDVLWKSLLLNQNTSQLAAGMNGSHKNFPEDTLSALLRSSSFEFQAVLTPHPGEMAGLTKLKVGEIQSDRKKIALEFAEKINKVIVLKGANTLIVGPTREIFENSFANPILATAGTGDVLSGIIAGFLAQGLSLINASIVSVYIHSKAAQKLSKDLGDSGMLASDLINKLPSVIKDLKSGS